jgi:hypothetical protein
VVKSVINRDRGYHHEGHEEHEGKKIIKIRSLFQSDCLFFVSFVRFVVNKKALLER